MVTNSSPNYRPDIDGLRALAIMGVLIYHIDGSILPGGFIGVDVFFVISGFLISSIIDRDLRQGSFSIARFYDRRIRRIVPALVAMIGAVLAASWLVLLPDDLAALGKSVKYVVVALPNLHFLKETENYFNESTNHIPLLHTWSLGVEEQFYVFFPLLLGILYRWRKSSWGRLAPLAVLFIVSLIASARVVPVEPMKAFFLLPYRAWEMLLGALVSLVLLPAAGRRTHDVLGVAGLLMIVASMALFDGQTQFPGPSALIPCGGAALVLWAGRRPTAWASRALSPKPWVLLGLISYSVYLWHWPLIALAKYAGAYTGSAKAIVLLASLGGGYLSWRFIEKPFRDPQRGSRARVFGAWAIASVLLLAAGLLIERSAGYPGRFSKEVGHFLAFKKKPAHWKRNADTGTDPGKAEVFGTPGVVAAVALWGDSHAMAILPGLEAAAKEHGQAFKRFGFSSLPPVAGVVQGSDSDPATHLAYSQAVLDLLVADVSIRTVVLHARWSLYNKGKNESGETAAADFYGQSFRDAGELEAFYAARIRDTVQRLLAAGKKVVLIYPVPEAGVNVPDRLAKRVIAKAPLDPPLGAGDFFARQGFVMGVLDSLGGPDSILRVKPHQQMLRDGRLTVLVDGQSCYMDSNHLSVPGALNLKGLLGQIFSTTISPPARPDAPATDRKDRGSRSRGDTSF